MAVKSPEPTRFTCIAPLANFEADSDSLSLEDKLRIRAMTSEEHRSWQRDLVGALTGPVSLHAGSFAETRFVVEYDYMHSGGAVDTAWIMARAAQVVTALRLYDRGDVAIGVVAITQIAGAPFWPGSWPVRLSNVSLTVRPFWARYALEKEHAENFQKFWNAVSGSLEHPGPGIRIALDRLNSGYTKTEYEDQIIDAVIGLEAALAPEGSELSLRLSNRVAMLLGRDDYQRARIAKVVKAAYDLRSRIVHGTDTPQTVKVNDSHMRILEFSGMLERILARVITMTILLGSWCPRDKLIQRLDGALLSEEVRDDLIKKILGQANLLSNPTF